MQQIAGLTHDVLHMMGHNHRERGKPPCNYMRQKV